MKLKLKCIKCGREYPYEINKYNCPKCNDIKFSNLYPIGGYKSPSGLLVPFKKEHPNVIKAGDTPLDKNERLGFIYGMHNLWVLDDSVNPYGTHKDRRSEFIVKLGIELGVDKMVCMTAGNAGYSLSRYTYAAGIDFTALAFPAVTSEARRRTLEERGHVIMIDEEGRWKGIMKFRDFITIVKEYDKWERNKEWKKIWNVTNMYEPTSFASYKKVVYEIVGKKLDPDYIVCPIGSGDLFVGLWLGVKELKLKAKVIGAAPKGANAFVPAFKQKNDELILTEYDSEYKCEKLIAPYSAMLPFTNIAQEEGHIILEFTHEELADAMQKVKQVGLKCEPSAAAAFAVLPQLFNMCKNKKNRIVYNEIVVINTGSGIMN